MPLKKICILAAFFCSLCGTSAIGANGKALLPRWTEGKRTAMEVLGLPNARNKSLFSVDGYFEPMNWGPSAKFFVYDPATREYASLEYPGTRFSLTDGYIPMITAAHASGTLACEQTAFVAPFEHFESGVLATSFRVTNKTQKAKRLELRISIVPYSPYPGDTDKNHWYAAGKHAVYVDGRIFLWSRALISRIVSDTRGGIMVAIPFTLGPRQARTFAAFLPVVNSGMPIPEELKIFKYSSYDLKYAETADFWRARLENFSLPDPRYTRIARSQLAYLLIMLSENVPRGGPTKYNSFWARDGYFMIRAFAAAGERQIVRKALDAYEAALRPSGEVIPILGWNNKIYAGTKPEWDAEGEAIMAVYAAWQATHDANVLLEHYPLVKDAAIFEEELMAQTPEGIFPPSLSAEDIGSSTEEHFWDDYFGIAGFAYASKIAAEIGEFGDFARFDKDAKRLKKNLRASIAKIERNRHIDYIPNNAEDAASSSVARGTSPILWPTMAFPPDDPLVKSSFDIYWEKYIGPNGGGFRHGTGRRFWPYAGLILAHDYLLLGERNRAETMLEWTLSHQTIPGLYVWGEDIDPKTLLMGDGDMPHPTTAAEIINLLVALSDADK